MHLRCISVSSAATSARSRLFCTYASLKPSGTACRQAAKRAQTRRTRPFCIRLKGLSTAGEAREAGPAAPLMVCGALAVSGGLYALPGRARAAARRATRAPPPSRRRWRARRRRRASQPAVTSYGERFAVCGYILRGPLRSLRLHLKGSTGAATLSRRQPFLLISIAQCAAVVLHLWSAKVCAVPYCQAAARDLDVRG